MGLLIGTLLLVDLTSCIKDTAFKGETDFSGLQDHVLIVKGGVANFSASNIAFNNGDTTTVTLTLNLASVDLPTSDVKVTIAVDAPKVDDYNASTGKSFQLAPPSAYSIGTTTITIPAGQQFATTTVSFYKDQFDPAVSYILPISITDASGKGLSSNQNTIYYNVIGNPLAGLYSDVGYFYHPSAPRAIPADFKTITAVSSTILQVDLGDLGGAGYIADHPMERFYRDVRLFRLYEGTSQIQQLLIARSMIRNATA